MSFCIQHYHMWKDGFLDQCPKCREFKSKRYPYCQRCQLGISGDTLEKNYSLEHSEAWLKGDKNAKQFYAYVLQLNDGKYYVGHTRNLRPRLKEHRNGEVKSTVGMMPCLVYFEIKQNRELAAYREAELKGLRDANPRKLTKLIIEFQDLVREVKIE